MNAAYKKLAYERATLLALVRIAKDQLLPGEGEDRPKQFISCDELPYSESTVPEDDVIDVIIQLERVIKKRELEMSKFRFVAVESNYEQDWAEETEAPKPQAGQSHKGGAANGNPGRQGKDRGRQGNPKTAATR